LSGLSGWNWDFCGEERALLRTILPQAKQAEKDCRRRFMERARGFIEPPRQPMTPTIGRALRQRHDSLLTAPRGVRLDRRQSRLSLRAQT
jgi:hypothetical protein